MHDITIGQQHHLRFGTNESGSWAFGGWPNCRGVRKGLCMGAHLIATHVERYGWTSPSGEALRGKVVGPAEKMRQPFGVQLRGTKRAALCCCPCYGSLVKYIPMDPNLQDSIALHVANVVT